MGKVSTFLSFSSGTKARLVVSTGLLLTLPVVLRLVSFARLRRVFVAVATKLSRARSGAPNPDRIARTVAVADRALPGSRKCLSRSLAAETLLRAHGHSPTHRIGVDKDSDGTMEAHSWIEHEGRVLIGDLEDLARFEPLPPLDGGDET